MIELHELKAGLRVRGLVAGGDVTIVAVEPHGDGISMSSTGQTTARSEIAFSLRSGGSDRGGVWPSLDLRRGRSRLQARQ